MTGVESKSDLQRYESLFSDLWQSAIVRFSTVEIEKGLRVPNGEIILSDKELEEGERILYSEGAFEILERTVDAPFDFLWDLVEGETVLGEGRDIELLKHRPEERFLEGRQSRVFEERPRTDLHGVFTVEDSPEEYNNIVDELEYELQRASEPYYDIASCEYQYFDHHFRGKAKSDPEILVFGKTGIEFSVGDENRVSITVPHQVLSQTALSILPQRPYGSQKGWKIELADEELQGTDDGRVEFTEHLHFSGVESAYILLFIGEETFGFEEYYPSDPGEAPESVNSRYRVFNEYDQRDKLPDYLQGETPDVFEIAVLNALSTAGYLVQWFGESEFKVPNWSRESEGLPYDEVDLVAHRPDGSQILFVECTNKRISEKEPILDRTEEIAAVIREKDPEAVEVDLFESSRRKIVPVVATPQMPKEISEQVIEDFTEKGIVVLHGQRLSGIYNQSSEREDPVKIDVDREIWDMEVL